MSVSICGLNCSECEQKAFCKGCSETHGKPFGGSCAVARCCAANRRVSCKDCGSVCRMREKLLSELNSLGVADMGEVTSLNALLKLYYYQLAVCDYYGQFYACEDSCRVKFLRQAEHSTRLMRWFEQNADKASRELTERLSSSVR